MARYVTDEIPAAGLPEDAGQRRKRLDYAEKVTGSQPDKQIHRSVRRALADHYKALRLAERRPQTPRLGVRLFKLEIAWRELRGQLLRVPVDADISALWPPATAGWLADDALKAADWITEEVLPEIRAARQRIRAPRPDKVRMLRKGYGGFWHGHNRNGRNKNRRPLGDETLLGDWRGDYIEFGQGLDALSPGRIANPQHALSPGRIANSKSRVLDEGEAVPKEWLERFAKDAECKRVIGPRPQPWEPRKPTPRPPRPRNLAQWVHPADSADSGGYEVEVLLGGLIRRSGAPLKLLQPPATVAELGAGLNDGQPLAEAA